MDNLRNKKKLFLVALLMVAALCRVFAAGPNPMQNYTQEIVLIAVVPPASEVRQIVSTQDSNAISSAISDLYIDYGVVINLINMSPELLNDIMSSCISKIAEEINRGAFNEGSSAGMLIRTSNSQFKITKDGVAYTALGDDGKGEIKTIIKSLVNDYSIEKINYAERIAKAVK